MFSAICTFTALNAQNKKDGTPDMRYKANKDLYGSPSYSAPLYYESKPERSYDSGGQSKASGWLFYKQRNLSRAPY